MIPHLFAFVHRVGADHFVPKRSTSARVNHAIMAELVNQVQVGFDVCAHGDFPGLTVALTLTSVHHNLAWEVQHVSTASVDSHAFAQRDDGAFDAKFVSGFQ